jgi:hypothetical protein
MSEKIKQYLRYLPIVLSGLLLIFLLILAFDRVFRPFDMAKLFPKDQTIILANLNTDNKKPLYRNFQEQLKNYQIILPEIENLNIDVDILPWLGRQAGFAMTQNMNSTESINTYLFFHIDDLEILNQTLADKKLQSFPLYNFGPETYGFLSRNHLIVTGDKEAIKDFYQFDDLEPVNSDYSYLRVKDNLPPNNNIFGYVNFQNINTGFFHFFPLLSKQGFSLTNVQPIIDKIISEGFVVIFEEEQIAIQSFLNLKKHSDDPDFSKEKYKANLLKYLSKDTSSFWGGHDFYTQFQKFTTTIFGHQNNLFTQGLISGFGKKYFGQDFNIQEILPLLQNEYLISFQAKGNRAVYKLIVSLNSKDEQQIIRNLAARFANLAAIYKPKVVQYTLPDDTSSKEIIAIRENISQISTNYEGLDLYQLKLGSKPWGIYYFFYNNEVIFTTELEEALTTINLLKNPEESFKHQLFNQENIQNLLVNADEISFVRPHKLINYFEEETEGLLLQLLRSIDNVLTSRIYFNDGIVSISYIQPRKK